MWGPGGVEVEPVWLLWVKEWAGRRQQGCQLEGHTLLCHFSYLYSRAGAQRAAWLGRRQRLKVHAGARQHADLGVVARISRQLHPVLHGSR